MVAEEELLLVTASDGHWVVDDMAHTIPVVVAVVEPDKSLLSPELWLLLLLPLLLLPLTLL